MPLLLAVTDSIWRELFTGNNIYGGTYGIVLTLGAIDIKIDNNILSSSEYSVVGRATSVSVIISNNNLYGIVSMSYAENTRIQNNTLNSIEDGIRVISSHNVQAYGNSITALNGYIATNVASNQVHDNVIASTLSGISMINCTQFDLYRNTITGDSLSGFSGILFKSSNTSSATNNILKSGGVV
jgi:hypothetical protein